MSELKTLAQAAGTALTQAGATLAVAESCTGGWLAQTLTGVPGCSAWFDRGFVAYSYDARVEMLGIEPALLDTHGAVSEAAVRAAAAAVLLHSAADVSIAISGVAGPGGGTPEKPVGLVWMAFGRSVPASSGPQDTSPGIQAVEHRFDGDRDAIRRQSVAAALEGVVAFLEDD